MITNTLAIIFPIFFITFLGFVTAKVKKIDQKTLANYMVFIASPALVFTQLSMQKINLAELASISLAATTTILGCVLAAYLFFKITRINAPAGLYLPIMSMNSGFIGFPLTLLALGVAGLSQAIIYNMVNAIFIFTLGIFIVSQGRDRWQFLKVPFIYAAILGITLSLVGIKIPQYMFSPLYLLGGSAIPIALFMLGGRLTTIKISAWKLPLLAASLRLGLGLGLGLLSVFLFKLQGTAASVVILLSSLSSGVTAVALAEEYDSNPDLVASTVALSMILSIFVIAGVLQWLI
ncbi:MAG: AEC family transporter [bacterium]